MLYSADTVFKVLHLPLSYYQTIFFSTFKGTALSKTFITTVFNFSKQILRLSLTFMHLIPELIYHSKNPFLLRIYVLLFGTEKR